MERDLRHEPATGSGVAAGGAAESHDWVQRARQGDLEAFAELVREHHGAVYAVVRRMVDEDQVAEELTQDAFLRAFRGLPGFRADARFSTWIHRIAVHLCLDWRASRRHRQERLETSLEALSAAGYDPATEEPGPDQIRELREAEASLQRQLATLSDEHRAAFLLRHQEGRSYEEIAEVLGITVTNAKVRVHRAREALLRGLRADRGES